MCLLLDSQRSSSRPANPVARQLPTEWPYPQGRRHYNCQLKRQSCSIRLVGTALKVLGSHYCMGCTWGVSKSPVNFKKWAMPHDSVTNSCPCHRQSSRNGLSLPFSSFCHMSLIQMLLVKLKKGLYHPVKFRGRGSRYFSGNKDLDGVVPFDAKC